MKTKTTICKICNQEFSFQFGFAVGHQKRLLCSDKCRKVNNKLYGRNYQRDHHPPTTKIARWKKSDYSITPQDDFTLFYDMLYLNINDDELGTVMTDDDVRQTARQLTLERDAQLMNFQLRTYQFRNN